MIRTILILFFLGLNIGTRAQEGKFYFYLSQGDTASALKEFRQSVYKDSDNLEFILDDAESLILNSRKTDTASLDALSLAFMKLAENQPEFSSEYTLRRAMLLIAHSEHFKEEVISYLLTCISGNPGDCPDVLFEEALDIKAQEVREGKADWKDLTELWIGLDRILAKREPDLSGIPITQRENLRSIVRPLIPGCEVMENEIIIPLADKRLSESNARIYLAAINLKPCPSFAMAPRLSSIAAGNDSYWLRIAAHYTNIPEDRLDYYSEAYKHEDSPRIKAADLVHMASVHKLMQQFEKAAKKLKEAQKLAPEWGMPWLEMAELYVEGSAFCGFDEFEKKAVFWEAISLCQEARNRDPDFEQLATERIFRYQLRTPDKKEVAFRGLRPGDTFPLGCWMEIATTVPEF